MLVYLDSFQLEGGYMTSTRFSPSSHDDVPLNEIYHASCHAPSLQVLRFPCCLLSGKNVLAKEKARETLFPGFG